MGSRRKGRVIAFQTLYSWDITGDSIQELLKFRWLDPETNNTDQQAIDFARLLASGTIESIGEVDEKIKSHLVNWDIKRLTKVDLALLRISVYSLMFRKEIPSTVTIDEAVDIAKQYGNDDSYKFVNGVLDSIRKEDEKI